LKVPDKLLPAGANIWYQDGDIAMNADFAAHGKTVRFYWNVSQISQANGVIWQVTNAFLGNDDVSLQPSSLLDSGQGSGAKGSFTVDFAKLPNPAGAERRMTADITPVWFVRILPVASAKVVGKPSNVIRVYDDQMPKSKGPDFQLKPEGDWYVQPGMQIRLIRFELEPYKYVDEWPSGCEPYHGQGEKTGWSWATGAVKDAFDWTSTAYSDMQNYVVTGVVTVLPFVPPETAKTALQVALTSAGIPPSVPNLDQLMTNGADYLAGQMVDEFANQVPAGSELAQLGKEELRKQLRQQTRDTILQNAQKMRKALASKSKYCTDFESPPFLKLTVQNQSSAPYQNIQIKLDFVEMNIPRDDYVLVPFKPILIDRLDPAESLTIPVDIFSHMNVRAVPEDKSTSYTEKDSYHWMQLYRQAEFRFVVSGAQSIKYRAKSENGFHLEEVLLNDGSGFFYKTPRRSWMSDPFVGP
jgi:hypothetical protein